MVMKRVVQLEKALSKGLDRLARRGGSAHDPLEWIAPVLEELVQQAVSTGGGGRRFPHEVVLVEVRGGEAHVEAARRALAATDLRARAVARLRRARCAFPESLAVRVRFRTADAAGAEPSWRVSYRAASPARPGSNATAAAAPDWLELTVLAGGTGRRVYMLDRDRIHVGRLAVVEGRRPGETRRNDVAFEDDGQPANSMVSRAHARIVRAGPHEFLIFDERSTHGTRVLRRGREIVVSAGDRRGVKLESGDELLLGGQARLRVRLRPAPSRPTSPRAG